MWADELQSSDVVLLEKLASVLAVDPAPAAEPSPQEFAFLAAVVADRQTARAADPSDANTCPPDTSSRIVSIDAARHRLRRYAPRMMAVVGAATLLVGTANAAAATGAVQLPRTMRQVEWDVGVPGVESPALTDLRDTLATLVRATRTHDTAAEQAAAAKLAQQYHRLDSGEKKDGLSDIAKQDPAVVASVTAGPSGTTPPSPTDTTPPAADTTPPGPADTTPPGASDTTPPPTDTTPPTADTTPPTDTTPPGPAETTPPGASDTTPPPPDTTPPTDTTPS